MVQRFLYRRKFISNFILKIKSLVICEEDLQGKRKRELMFLHVHFIDD